MKRARGSLVGWYLAVISLAFGLVIAHPTAVAAMACDVDPCEVSWCSCVGACNILYNAGSSRMSTDCWELVCYEGDCAMMDGGTDDCVYVCCTDFVRQCVNWF